MTTVMDDNSKIKQQIEYYRRRAPEYDQWHQRLGRYDRGENNRQRWFTELENVRTALKQNAPFGECLELACGTGLWTQFLSQDADSLTAVDAAPETIEINRARVKDESIRYEIADIFEYFHQVDDGYSHLAAQVLQSLAVRYNIELRCHLVRGPGETTCPSPIYC